MKLFLLSQTVNSGYDTYDSCVVCAEDEEKARETKPQYAELAWAEPKDINVQYLGEASEVCKVGVICASFNAG